MKQATTTGTGKYEALLERCRSLAPVPTAVAYPCEASALAGAVEAAQKKLIVPILVGPAAKIAEIAKSAGLDLGGLEIIDAPDSHAAAEKAVALVREGRAEVLMKGSLHTDELLSAVVSREKGLRTGRRISHAFLMDVPTYHKVLIVTDAAINIAPTLEDKVDICQNAIDLAISLGVETSPRSRSSPRSKRSIPRCRPRSTPPPCARWPTAGRSRADSLDGPLAFDNAISKEAAKTKGIDFGGRRRSGHPARAGPRSRQHSGQATQLPGERGQRGAGAGGESPHHPHQPRRQRAIADRQLCRRRIWWPTPGGPSREGVVMDAYALVLNAGSSSLKFCVFQRPPGAAWQVEARGQIEGIGTSPRHVRQGRPGREAGSTRSWTRRSATAAPPSTPSRPGSGRTIRAAASSASATGSSTAARASAAPPWSRARSWPS